MWPVLMGKACYVNLSNEMVDIFTKFCILNSILFTSFQVCRVAYELMQTLHGDASQKFRSLDDIFYYGGQNGHDLRVLEAHPGSSSGLIQIKVTLKLSKAVTELFYTWSVRKFSNTGLAFALNVLKSSFKPCFGSLY